MSENHQASQRCYPSESVQHVGQRIGTRVPRYQMIRGGINRDHARPGQLTWQNCRITAGLEDVWSARNAGRIIEEAQRLPEIVSGSRPIDQPSSLLFLRGQNEKLASVEPQNNENFFRKLGRWFLGK